MIISIPRGKIYHKISFDFINFIKSFFVSLNNKKDVELFENQFAKYMKSNYCVSFPFARSAVYHSLKSQNFSPGDEIIMPPITIKPMLEAVLELGLKPIFVDINLDSLCFELERLKSSISDNTKAILITYLYGVVPDISEIVFFAKQKNLFVIEDFSQCLNGVFRNTKVGNFGDVGIYSSSSTKTLDTYGGGLCITNSEKIYKNLKNFQSKFSPASRIRVTKAVFIDLTRNLLTNKWVFSLITFQVIKFMEFIKKNSTLKMLGDRPKILSNSLPNYWFENFTSFQANVGLDILNKNIIVEQDKLRIDNTKKIMNKFSHFNFPKANFGTNVYWQCLVYSNCTAENRSSFRDYNVDTASTSLLLLSELIEKDINLTPNARYLLNNSFFIPNFSQLSEKDLDQIMRVEFE